MFDDILNELNNLLVEFFDQEELEVLFSSLPPVDPVPLRDAEFWLNHKRTVMHRTLVYSLSHLKIDLSMQKDELSDVSAEQVISFLESILEKGITYADIRLWWLRGGAFGHALAVQARRERERYAKAAFSLLFFFENKHPLWLTYENGVPSLTKEKENAHRFDRFGWIAPNGQQLTNLGADLEYLRHELQAVSYKILPNTL